MLHARSEPRTTLVSEAGGSRRQAFSAYRRTAGAAIVWCNSRKPARASLRLCNVRITALILTTMWHSTARAKWSPGGTSRIPDNERGRRKAASNPIFATISDKSHPKRDRIPSQACSARAACAWRCGRVNNLEFTWARCRNGHGEPHCRSIDRRVRRR